ncbi:MAG: hypothetical protein Q8K11_15735, partial [Phenylobacterium sp.]|uniref:hypothetical protein n=1 Tax=Phenylobacterium sp. TaxID=1871053 RepID=UPI002730B5F0
DGRPNRRATQRCGTPPQTAWTQRLAIGHTPRGVKAVKTGWTAVITVDGERLRLGVFATLEAAAKAYDEAARALRGEYAVLNTQPARKPPPRGDRLALSDAADAHLTSFSRFKATWPKLCEEDGFPRPHILGGSAALIWSRSEIEDWKLAQERAIGAKLSRDFRRSQHPAKP